jgi:predicted metal-dependent hydrolase
LWNEGLFFEVHEVLEDVWRTVSGPVRQALQGVIQIAVAYHHQAHGNARGARSLLAEGRARLADVGEDTLPRLDRRALLDATAQADAAAGPPQLVLRS